MREKEASAAAAAAVDTRLGMAWKAISLLCKDSNGLPAQAGILRQAGHLLVGSSMWVHEMGEVRGCGAALPVRRRATCAARGQG